MESVPLQRAGKDLFQVIEEVKERLLTESGRLLYVKVERMRVELSKN
jgi:hypothetical protein